MEQAHLFPLIRAKLHASLHGYLVHDALAEAHLDRYIIPPALGHRSGILGTLALAGAMLPDSL